MTPKELQDELKAIVQNKIMDAVLILGKSGIGKTSIVDQVGEHFDMDVWDVRWGQLSPADARGVPVPNHATKETEFYAPTFWPRKGPGIIFLDEFNMASPVMMGLGQQLLLDRKFGDYKVPNDIFIWAAGNRKIDKATVNNIPGPVQNRVAHYEIEEDLWAWKIWAYAHGIQPSLISFLDFRSDLLHKPSETSMAWPSPRSIEMANTRLVAGMNIAPVVGQPFEDEFYAHLELAKLIPNVDLIEIGKGLSIEFPTEPSIRYALASEMIHRSLKSFEQYENCVKWSAVKCLDEPEWVTIVVQDVIKLLAATDKKKQREYLTRLTGTVELKRFIKEIVKLGGLI